MALYGAGLGTANPPLLIAVQTSVPWNRRGVATASTLFFRTIGGTLAVGLLGGVLANALSGAGAPAGLVEKLLGPERAIARPRAWSRRSPARCRARCRSSSGPAAAIACTAFVVVLGFPHVAVAGAAAQSATEA